jgi:hypothetical protein
MSWVVRLVPDALAAGALVGEVERVATGERTAFRSADELVAACRRQLSESPLPVDVVESDTTVIPLPRARGRVSQRRGTP